jgi:tRNA-specific adenosine deaminase 1
VLLLGEINDVYTVALTMSDFLRTGMKCLPRNKVPNANGIVLHDCHAEILAIRTFNRFLIEECYMLATGKAVESSIVERRAPTEISIESRQPFAIRDGVKIHMYCSEAPCGDASMELIMQAQEDATPWVQKPEGMAGRGDFAQLGVVRRKPGSLPSTHYDRILLIKNL